MARRSTCGPVLDVPSQHRTLQIVGRAEKIDAILGGQDKSEPMARNLRDQIQMFKAGAE
jgi:hypothetical protein